MRWNKNNLNTNQPRLPVAAGAGGRGSDRDRLSGRAINTCHESEPAGRPPYRKFGRTAVYRRGDLIKWAEARMSPLRSSSAEADTNGVKADARHGKQERKGGLPNLRNARRAAMRLGVGDRKQTSGSPAGSGTSVASSGISPARGPIVCARSSGGHRERPTSPADRHGAPTWPTFRSSAPGKSA